MKHLIGATITWNHWSAAIQGRPWLAGGTATEDIFASNLVSLYAAGEETALLLFIPSSLFLEAVSLHHSAYAP